MTLDLDSDSDLDALRLTPQVKFAAVVLGIAGFLYLLLGVQTHSILLVQGIYWIAVPAMFGLGGGMVYLALRLAKMDSFASNWGMYAAATACLLALAWLVFTAMNSVFSLSVIIVIPVTGAAAVLVRESRAATSAATTARRRLEAAGLEAGF